MSRRKERVGVLTRLEPFRHENDRTVGPVDGMVQGGYQVYLDDDDEPIGFVHSNQVVNRVEVGERVRVHTVEGSERIRKLRPADRKLRWWQF